MAFETEKYQINNNANLWKKIFQLNEKFSVFNFNSIKYEEIKYKKNTSYNKVYWYRTGDNFDYDSFVIAQIVDKIDYYQDLLTQDKELLSKYKAYKQYEEEITKVYQENRLYKSVYNCPMDNCNIFSKFFGASSEDRFRELSHYEDHIFWDKKLHPKFPEILVIIEAQTRYRDYYSGEQKTNTHRDSKRYYFLEILQLYRMAKEKIGKMSFVEQQRAMMSDKLRYAVLSRDKFKCQICGCSQQDGVKLEVDHIIPVSKGGRTELDNLQTLCERCNRGKRDEMPTNIPSYSPPTQPVSALISKPTISQERTTVNSSAYYNSPTTNTSSTSKMSKAEAKQLCIKNNISISSTITFASSNDSASRKYWANPNINVLNKDWTLILNDKIGKELHIFRIPAGTIKEWQLKMRSDNDDLIDLQIFYGDKSFQDSRSRWAFAPYYIKTIAY